MNYQRRAAAGGGAPTAAQLYIPYCTTLSIVANSALTEVIDTAIPRTLSISGASNLTTFAPTSFNSTGTVSMTITGAALTQATVEGLLDLCVALGGSGGTLNLSGGTTWAPPIQTAEQPAVAQMEKFTFTGDAAVDGVQSGEYLTFSDQAGTGYYLWFKVGGSGIDPAPGGTGVLLEASSGWTPTDMAAAAVMALSSAIPSGITFSSSGGELTLTQTSAGACADGSAGTATGVSATVTTNGAAITPAAPHADIVTLLASGWTVTTN